jgi:hypothetical protein
MLRKYLSALASLAVAAVVGGAWSPSAAVAAAPFTFVVIPDTQNYTDFPDINLEYNIGQMNWIVNNKTTQNIKFAMHLGDLQNPGNPYRASTTDIYAADTSRPLDNESEAQAKLTKWNRAEAGINVLDAGGIPYSLVAGNHDYLDHNTKSEPWLYLQRFGPNRYITKPKKDELNQTTYGGSSPAHPVNDYAGMNSYHRVNAGGYRFLNIGLQYAPDEHDLRWAQQIINENPGLPTIVTTHAYVNTKPAANDYQRQNIFDTLVKNNPQIFMTFNGHLTGSNYVEGTNVAGHSVHQFLVDFQASQLDEQLGDDYYRGGGTLRLVKFDLDNNNIGISDYSPIANKTLPRNFTAPDNDNDIATYSTPASVSVDFDARFGLPNKAGIVKSTSFRQGSGGYAGTGDTYIDQNAPTSNFGSATSIWVDGDRNGATTGSPDSQAMIRFNSIFGSGAGQVPLGAQIESAQLVLHTSDDPDAVSPNTISLYRLLQNWDSTAAKWDTFDGFEDDGVEALLAANDTAVPNTQNGFVTFDVTESILAWSSGATNMGWVLRPGGGNGWQFDSSEAAGLLNRPQLNVTFRVVPEPAAFGFTAAVVAALLGRRRSRALRV